MLKFHHIRRLVPVLLASTLIIGVTACSTGGKASDVPSEPEAVDQSVEVADVEASEAPLGDLFDINSVDFAPELDGKFPYLEMPENYEHPNGDPAINDYGRFPFWTGDRLEWTEGKVYQALIHSKSGYNFSSIEVKKYIQEQVFALDGVLVTDSEIPRSEIAEIDDETIQAYLDGLGDIWNNNVNTYVVRTPTKVVWVHVCTTSASGSWLIMETKM